MASTLLHPRDQLVAIMNRIYHNGMTTLSGGNLSIKDERGDIWITPAGVDKGMLGARDIMVVRAGGTVEGPHRPSSEYPFHHAIYARRPDLRAIVHAHAPALVSFSLARRVPETAVLAQTARMCGPVGYAPYALTGSAALGDSLAGAFGDGYNIIILENHGVAAGGSTLLEAFQRLEALELCARTLIAARRLGTVRPLSAADLRLADAEQADLPAFTPTGHSSHERDLRKQLAEIVRRAVARGLMSSRVGVASVRLDKDSFLITPAGGDNGGLEAPDVALVRGGAREEGSQPSRAARLHAAIYAAQPEVQAVLAAQSPHATAYAISGAPFDTRTIPESYVLLRDMPLVPFQTVHADPQQVAELASLRTPVLLLQNEGVLAVGTSLLNAFDRLEVAEFSARSLLDTAVLGPLMPIDDAALEELRAAFDLG